MMLGHAPPERITDGDRTTQSFWDSGNVESEPEVTIDLGKDYDLESLNVETYYDGTRYYQYEVYAGDEDGSWTKIAEKTDEEAADADGDTYTLENVFARYLRISFIGSSSAARHLIEVEAYAQAEKHETNLAEGKTVSVTKTLEGNATAITDGNKNASPYWAASAPLPQSAVIDLEKEALIDEIDVYPYFSASQPRGYRYTVSVSNDGVEYTTVAQKETPYKQISAGDKYAFAEPVKARYVKIEMLENKCPGDPNNTGAHLSEVQVLGKYVDGEETAENVALDKPVTASVDNSSYPAAVITDGARSGGYWDGGEAPAYFEIDLEGYYRIEELKLFPYSGNPKRGYHYSIYASDNGTDYQKIAEKTDDELVSGNGESYVMSEEIIARYIRVAMTYNTLSATSSNRSVHMHEMEVYGEEVSDHTPSEPATIDPNDPENLAFGKTTTANMNKKTSQLAVDGITEYGWDAKIYPANVEVDLGQAYDLSDVQLFFPTDGTAVYKYTLYGSADGENYTRMYQKRDDAAASVNGDTIEELENNEGIRYVRLNVEYNSEGAKSLLSELRVHGTFSNAQTADKDTKLELTPFAETEYAQQLEVSELLEGIVTRTVGAQYTDWFEFVQVEKDTENDFYRISDHDGKIRIEGTSGVAIASGLNYYYKYYCNVNITEVANQTKMPDQIVPVNTVIEKESPYKVRYAFNYCTLSYSFPYYDLEDWQHELDWLALNGVNCVLDLAGQEAVWILFLQELGYSYEDARNWLAGPGYYAWQFMGNLEYINGSVPEGWIEDRVELARITGQWKTSMGMQTVMQGYAGMVPTNIEDFVSDPAIIDNLLPQGGWGGLDRPWMVRTDTEAYEILSEKFYAAQEIVYGDANHYYAVDPFHEGGIRPSDLTDEVIAQNVLENLVDRYDEDAVWLIQHWWSNPTDSLLEGLEGYRDDHAMILNLTSVPDTGDSAGSTGIPDDARFKNTPWVYCMLESYGGNASLDANLEVLANIPQLVKDKGNTTLQGIGIISEATLDVPAAYDLLWEMAWEDSSIDLDQWIESYITRRYGTFSDNAYEAWMYLKDSVYSSSRGTFGNLMSQNPDLNLSLSKVKYSEADLEKAFLLLRSPARSSATISIHS